MLISEFANTVGLSTETVRFYVGQGLLKPRRSALGGKNSYQVFSAADVTAVRMVQLQKSLGYSLSEIAELNREYRSGAKSALRTAEVLRKQIERLQEQRAQLDTALSFLTQKLAWVEGGGPGEAPQFPC